MGTFTFADGSKYVGEFKDGKRNGQGRQETQGAYKYASDGRLIRTIRGDLYDGEFKDNKFNGQGYYSYDGGSYKGEFKDGKRNGQGTQTFADGDRYVGEFKDDKRNGQGTQIDAHGYRKYVGEFKDGKRNGQFTVTYVDGAKFVGEFKDDEFNGQGTQTFANGNKYVGEFKDDKRNGQFTVTYSNGNKFVGEFKDDERNGQGTEYASNGSIINQGIFANDKFVRSAPLQRGPIAPLTKDMRPGSVHQDCANCPEMVVIPAGRFVMGAPSEEEEREKLPDNLRNRSQPQHDRRISSFLAGRYEITVGQYRAFAIATNQRSNDLGGCFVWNGTEWKNDTTKSWRNPGFSQSDTHPVVCMSAHDAKDYTDWLQEMTGQAYRLLTEAQWEYAARADTRTARYWGDDVTKSCAYANVLDLKAKTTTLGASNLATFNCDDGYAFTAPVGSYKANGFGLFDMLGNVWEWTRDCWKEDYVGAPNDGTAWGEPDLGYSWNNLDCRRGGLRGGSWQNNAWSVRAANRIRNSNDFRSTSSGFRVARSLQ